MKRPYPWKCHTCRKREVFPGVVDYSTDMEHDGRVYTITAKDLEVLRCQACHTQVLPDEAHAVLARELRRQAGLLQPQEIIANRERLGLNQKDFACLLGVAPATVCRWESGGQIQQRVMNDFMKAFFELDPLREYLRRLRGLNGEAAPVAATDPSMAEAVPPATPSA